MKNNAKVVAHVSLLSVVTACSMPALGLLNKGGPVDPEDVSGVWVGRTSVQTPIAFLVHGGQIAVEILPDTSGPSGRTVRTSSFLEGHGTPLGVSDAGLAVKRDSFWKGCPERVSGLFGIEGKAAGEGRTAGVRSQGGCDGALDYSWSAEKVSNIGNHVKGTQLIDDKGVWSARFDLLGGSDITVPKPGVFGRIGIGAAHFRSGTDFKGFFGVVLFKLAETGDQHEVGFYQLMDLNGKECQGSFAGKIVRTDENEVRHVAITGRNCVGEVQNGDALFGIGRSLDPPPTPSASMSSLPGAVP